MTNPSEPTGIFIQRDHADSGHTYMAAQATVVDEDGGNVRAVFRVSLNSGMTSYVDYPTTYATSGGIAMVTIALANNTTYYCQVYAQDPGALNSVLSPVHWFTTNRTPNAPTGLSPANGSAVSTTDNITFGWTFSDPDASDWQSGASFDWRVLGTGSWTRITVTGSGGPTVPGSTFGETTIEWRVATTDSGGLTGPYSATQQLNIAAPYVPPPPTPPNATPIPTGPANNSTVMDTDPVTLTWNVNGATQDCADVQWRPAGGIWTVIHDTGATASHTFAASSFVAGTTIQWQVRTSPDARSRGAMSEWSAQWAFYVAGATPVAPTITSPTSGADVDITSTPVQVAVAWDPLAPVASADVQWRPEGGSWTVDTATLPAPGLWTLPLSGLTAPVQIEVQARVKSSLADHQLTSWSPSVLFTLRTPPSAPTFTAPSSGGDVDATDLATVNFDASTPSTDRAARRVMDSAGTDIIEPVLTLTDLGSTYQVSGTPGVHPNGAEYVQARRRTSAGGNLWSPWASRAVTMVTAAPWMCAVRVTPLPADAANRFDLSFPTGDDDHPDPVRAEAWRDGQRVAMLDAAGASTTTWIDHLAPKDAEYSFAAITAAGGVAVSG